MARLEADMRNAAKNLEFERAATLRDQVQEIRLRVLAEDALITVGRGAERAGAGETVTTSPRPARGAVGPAAGLQGARRGPGHAPATTRARRSR